VVVLFNAHCIRPWYGANWGVKKAGHVIG
jgi:hypothetical protein